jgi:hypothetical protein
MDVENEGLVSRIENKSSIVFLSLLELFQLQSDLRQANIARKRQRNKQTSEVSSSMDIPQTDQTSLGIYFVSLFLIVDITSQTDIISQTDVTFQTDVSDYPPTDTTLQSTDPIPSIDPTLNSSTTVEVKSTHRVVSNSSIAGPTQDSAGGTRVWASNEKASDIFANIFLLYVISSIWPDGITLDWVQGRKGETKLVWSSKYYPISVFHYPSPLLVPDLYSRFPD